MKTFKEFRESINTSEAELSGIMNHGANSLEDEWESMKTLNL